MITTQQQNKFNYYLFYNLLAFGGWLICTEAHINFYIGNFQHTISLYNLFLILMN